MKLPQKSRLFRDERELFQPRHVKIVVRLREWRNQVKNTHAKGVRVNNFDPTIDLADSVVGLGNSIPFSSIAIVNDLDGDPIETYRLFDPANGGFFTLAGVEQSSGAYFDVAATEIGNLRYHASSSVNSEEIRAMVYDGERWSTEAIARLYSVTSPTSRPIVDAESALNVVANEKVLLSDFFTASDPDGYPIVRYKFKDTRVSSGGGYVESRGRATRQGDWTYVPASNIDTAYYVGANRLENETLLVRAYDGTKWSLVERISAGTTRNANRPMVTTFRSAVRSETTAALLDTFEVRDEDGSTMKSYRFLNTKRNGGYVEVDGVRQQSNVWVTISPEQMANARFVAADTFVEQDVRIRAYDGKFWSKIQTVNFQSIPDPTLDLLDEVVLDEGEPVSVSEFIRGQSDEGPRIVAYDFIDTNSSDVSGYFALDNVRLEADVVHRVTAREFDRLQFVGGRNHARRVDTIKVRGDYGSGGSNSFVGEWKNVNLYTEPHAFTSFIMEDFDDDQMNTWLDHLAPKSNGRLEITYSFPATLPIYYVDGTIDPPEEPTPSTNANQRSSIRKAMQLFDELIDVDFVEVNDTFVDPFDGSVGGMFRFQTYFEDSEVLAFAYAPSDRVTQPWGADIWINNFFPGNVLSLGPDSNSFLTLTHEIGHGMGMAHPFEAGSGAGLKTVLSPAIDDQSISVMSYTPNPNGTSARNLMLYDAYWLQQTYGADPETRTGDDTYQWNDVRFQDLIYDAGGEDVIDASNQTRSVNINLLQGQASTIGFVNDNVSIAFGTVIENAIGTGLGDTINGNEVSNKIWGGGGDDLISGGGGDDEFYGGAGADTYFFEASNGHNVIDEMKSAGRDTIVVRNSEALGLNDFTEDVSFQVLGRDLLVEFKTDGDDFRSGSLLIKDQKWSGSRVETLRILNDDGSQSGVDIDLSSVFVQTGSTSQSFAPTGTRGTFGFLVSPV